MKPEYLERAIAEARRFIKMANAAEARITEDKYALISGSRETAAVKRASMDLTRALADLRRTP